MNGPHIDALPSKRITSMTVYTGYSWVEIQTQARQLEGECTYLLSYPASLNREYVQNSEKFDSGSNNIPIGGYGFRFTHVLLNTHITLGPRWSLQHNLQLQA